MLIIKFINQKKNWLTKVLNFKIDHRAHGWKWKIEMFSAHTEEKLVVEEQFIRALGNKIYKYILLYWKIRTSIKLLN